MVADHAGFTHTSGYVSLTATYLGLMLSLGCSAGEYDEESPTAPVASTDLAVGPPIACNGDSDCTGALVKPACADVTCAKCNTAISQCTYRLKNSIDCPCIEGDIKRCKLTPSANGVNTCIKDTSSQTHWSACAPP